MIKHGRLECGVRGKHTEHNLMPNKQTLQVLEDGGTDSGFLRKPAGANGRKHFFHEYLQECCFVLTEVCENLRKPPGGCGRT